MKKILITGAHSYIGVSRGRLSGPLAGKICGGYAGCPGREVGSRPILPDMMRFSMWRGIAHPDVGHVSEERKAEYYAVNRT